jgi:DNA ligase 1
MTNHPIVLLKNQFDQIAKAKGKQKIPLIKTFATNGLFDNDLFLETYDFVFNPHISSGIAKKKMNKVLSTKPINSPVGLIDALRFVKENNTGSDAIVGALQAWILHQPEETHEFLKKVFTQDLQIGASEKALNKALGYDYIPVWDVMLGKRWENYSEKVTGDFTVTLKMDDYRCTAIFNETTRKWELKARSGLLYEEVIQIEELFEHMPKNYVYDGGLISDRTELDSKERFQHTGSLLRTKGPKTGLWFMIYDIIPLKEFKKGKSKLGYKQRQEVIEQLLNYDFLENIPHADLLHRVPMLYQGSDKGEIMPLLELVLSQNFEGLMINTNDGKYEKNRSANLLKVKQFYSVDLRITGYKEYKHPNMLGAFKVDYKGNEAWVGGGYSHQERKDFWEKRDEMIGKIIEVTYFQESKNQNGGVSIRHGHFEGLRDDKLEPSYD